MEYPHKQSMANLFYVDRALVWFIGVIIPMMVTGRFPNYAIFTALTFATYIIGDLIAIPFSYVFAKEADD